MWLLAVASFGLTETIEPNGHTTVRPFGLVFVLPCWALTYVNRRRVAFPIAPALVALAAVAVGLVELVTGWTWFSIRR